MGSRVWQQTLGWKADNLFSVSLRVSACALCPYESPHIQQSPNSSPIIPNSPYPGRLAALPGSLDC